MFIVNIKCKIVFSVTVSYVYNIRCSPLSNTEQWGIVNVSTIVQTYYVTGTKTLAISFKSPFIAVATHRGSGSSTTVVNRFDTTTIGARLGMPGETPKALPWAVHYIAVGV